MFDWLKDLWNYIFNPKTSTLLVMAEMDATLNEYKGWDSVKESIERDIRSMASGGGFQYEVPPGWRYYFKRGGPGRTHFKELGFKVRDMFMDGSFIYICWGRRAIAPPASK
jgi:hypothetical protein